MKTYISKSGFFWAVLMIFTCSGCTVQRGVDFGHWARSTERVYPVRFSNPSGQERASEISIIGIVPVFGNMEQSYLDQLNNNIISEAGFYVNAQLAPVQRDGKFAQYITKENVMPIDGVFNAREIARLGLLMGVSHMLACKVVESRLHPPQMLSLHFVVVDCSSFQTIIEMNARFDAAEQTTLLALDQHLQGRSSRKYDKTNLDIILRSPLEFGRFVSSECMKALSQEISNSSQKKLKSGSR